MTNVHAGTNRWNSLELYCIVNFGQLLIYMLSLFKDHAAWNMSWKNYPYPYTKKKCWVQGTGTSNKKKRLRKIRISSNFFLQPFQFILYVLCYIDTNNVLKLSLNQEFSPA